MVSQIERLAVKQDAYLAGDYLLLTFGRGTHVARIELESGKRYRIRRLQARGTRDAHWEAVTTWISKSDARILGRLGFPDVIRLAPHCPPVSEWVELAATFQRKHEAQAEAEGEARVGSWSHTKAAARYAEEVEVLGPALPVVQEEPVEASPSPTKTQYAELDLAYGWFNEALFGGELPYCLLTMNRKAKAHGYFCGDRFQTRDGAIVTDEIALNPDSMRDRDDRASLATLVHEMVHLWQHRFGEPPRKSYHDRQWALKMREVGLIPSSTGEPGGKETGSRVTHYIEEGGRFAVSYERLVASGWTMPFIQTPGDVARAKKQKASKTKFCCPSCEQAAWGKPTLKIICSECDEIMVAADAETAGEEA